MVVGQKDSKVSDTVTPSGKHVGFLYYEGKNGAGVDVIQLLGGNQKFDISNRRKSSVLSRVTITEFKMSQWGIVARRMPRKEDKK